MKISIIGAGNVGGLTAMRILEQGIADVVLVDIAKNLAKAKAFDLDDARAIAKHTSPIEGTEDFSKIKDSDIVVVTAGLARRPGMTREDLLRKNYNIVKTISKNIRKLARNSIVIAVCNPVDIMTYVLLKEIGFDKKRVFGMGLGLDSSRFSNLISLKLKVPSNKVKALVIGSHGETMLPLPRLSTVNNRPLDKVLSKKDIDGLVNSTKKRGAEIVGLYGSGSAYFAPSAAILEICLAIKNNSKDAIPVSAYLEGEYGISKVCIGVPAKIDRSGIREIVKLDLDATEKELLIESAKAIKKGIKFIYKKK
ncbi:MAG: malate dehydrogenase [Candidatus Omnitrophota bacterium]